MMHSWVLTISARFALLLQDLVCCYRDLRFKRRLIDHSTPLLLFVRCSDSSKNTGGCMSM
jgi:hypothetical protein